MMDGKPWNPGFTPWNRITKMIFKYYTDSPVSSSIRTLSALYSNNGCIMPVNCDGLQTDLAAEMSVSVLVAGEQVGSDSLCADDGVQNEIEVSDSGYDIRQVMSVEAVRSNKSACSVAL